ncbi:MAG: DNA-directed RNA polymerase subunit F [Candidatus Diapherotrites archaeon CG11_big_fil_rev_8_21_14_0_20_37_9]|nr:MAG: DNA-directed RNA polymerase subunit F [Candidatus Diapherotrites archaeon CG11_big_fil_rev_8_21_14_0_20_37_9]
MIGKKIVSQNYVPVFQVKEVLAERNKEGELSYEQQQAFDYSKKFSRVTPAKGEKLLKELQQIEGLDEDVIVKAIDILPADIETATLIFHKTDGVDQEKIKQLVDITSKYVK